MKAPTWTPITCRLGDLKPWAQNPRYSTKAQAERILASFKEFGQVQAVAVGPALEVYDGHQRLSALLTLHGPEYQIDARQSSRELTDKERQKLVVTLHTGATGQWNWDSLGNWDAGELQEWGMGADTVKEWNTDAAQLRTMLEAAQAEGADAEPEVDRAAELREKWGVVRGDLWAVGEHRLLCGDSTSREDVERVMGGEKARLCFTSPPYAQQREYEIGKFDWLALMNGVTDNLFPVMGAPADVLINLGMPYVGGRVNQYWQPWLEHCEELGHPLYGWYVWDKGGGLPGEWNGRLTPAHEWIFHFSIGRESANKWIATQLGSTNHELTGASARKKDGKRQKKPCSPGKYGQAYKIPDSVMRVVRESNPDNSRDHPAVYPVALPEFGIRTWGKEGCTVYEPFSGSGTTIVACQNLGRKCRAIELSPNYVAVALERCAIAFPGLDIHRVDG